MTKRFGLSVLAVACLAGCAQQPIAVQPTSSVTSSKSHVVSVESEGQSRTEGTSRNSHSDAGGSQATVEVSAQQTDSKGNSSKRDSVMKVSSEGANANSLGFTQDEHNLGVTGSNVTKEWTVSGQDVAVSGSNNTLTFRGKTHGLSVTGSGNKVMVDNPEMVEVSGEENSVTYQGPAPTIKKTGLRNAVVAKE